MTSCNTMTGQEIQDAFLAAPPLISQQILDLSIKHPNWLRDLFEVEEWPRGNGTIMEQLVFRGALPQIERGFDLWKKLNNNTGCDVSCSPDCGYNWTQFGGHGFERKITELMRREFRSPSYCISEIQTTAHFKEVFAKVVENLYVQVDFFKEMNIGLNFLTGLAKKYVVDSGGAKPNTNNPYMYRPIGAARISNLNITLLEFFYEQMRRLPDCVPYDVVNGSPIFSLIASHQLLAHLYRDDPNLRQDVRFSGMANDMLMKYNFMSTIRGMFIAAPVLYPRRFNYTAGNTWVEVLPFLNGVPAEVGAYTGFNPAYEAATHEEVLLHGKFPFKVFYFPTETTLGQNSSFGPEYSWFNAWSWVNPQTIQDPFRRVGYFATSASIGLSQQFSDGIFAVLVERPSVRTMAVFNAEPECPPDPVDCDNEVPAVICPCQLILSVTANPITPGRYFFTFNSPLGADVQAQDSIQIGIDTGGYLTGTIQSLSADHLSAEISFTSTCPPCVHFISVYCDDTLGCSSDVISACECSVAEGEGGASIPAISLVLKNPIKADALDAVTVYFCDGTSAAAIVQNVSLCSNTYTITFNDPSVVCLDNSLIVSICVPPETDATCPACGQGPTVVYCS